MADRAQDLGSLAATLGTTLLASEPMAWGDASATWRLDFGDGQRVVVRRFERSERGRAETIVECMRSAASAGIPVPRAMSASTATSCWIVSDHVPGTIGAAWLEHLDRARTLARSMGGLWRRLGGVAVDGPAGTIRADTGVREGFVHGDFAPVNVIVGDDAEILALVDFEHAHVGDRLEDAAWWSWVVRHHHPDAWVASWPTFCAAAGIDRSDHQATLRGLMLRQLERRAESAPDRRSRRRWGARLIEAAAW